MYWHCNNACAYTISWTRIRFEIYSPPEPRTCIVHGSARKYDRANNNAHAYTYFVRTRMSCLRTLYEYLQRSLQLTHYCGDDDVLRVSFRFRSRDHASRTRFTRVVKKPLHRPCRTSRQHTVNSFPMPKRTKLFSNVTCTRARGLWNIMVPLRTNYYNRFTNEDNINTEK